MIPRRAARSLSIGKNRATNPDFPFLATVQSVSSKCQAPGYLLRKGCLGSCKLQRRSHQVEQKHSNLFQPLFPIESPMHIASIPRYHGEALFPLRKRMPFQKVVRRNQIIDSRQAQLLHQTVLQRPKLSLDASFGLRTGAPIHSVPSSRKARPNCERASSPRSCSCKAAAPLRWRKMLCLSVQCADGRPYRCNQLQPASQHAQVFFGGILRYQTGPQSTAGIIDYRNQRTPRSALREPPERRTILHHQLSKACSLYMLRAGTPQLRPGNSFPQRLAANLAALLRQVLRDQCETEVGIPLANPGQNLLLQPRASMRFKGRPRSW
jgi:hypothetical protein